MAIEGTYLASSSVTTNTTIVIEMLSSRPVLGAVFTPAKPVGQLCGYYDAMTGNVELYVVAASGIRFLKVA